MQYSQFFSLLLPPLSLRDKTGTALQNMSVPVKGGAERQLTQLLLSDSGIYIRAEKCWPKLDTLYLLFPKLCRKKQNVPKCPSISSLIGVEFVLFHFSREVPTLIHFKEH